jgi:hypothetical protein
MRFLASLRAERWRPKKPMRISAAWGCRHWILSHLESASYEHQTGRKSSILCRDSRRVRHRSSRLGAGSGHEARTGERLDESLASFGCSSRLKLERSGFRVIFSTEGRPEGSGLVLKSAPECQPCHAQCKTTTRGPGRSPRGSPCQSLEGKGLNLRRPCEPVCQGPCQDGSMASGCPFSEALALLTSQPAAQGRPYIKVTCKRARTPIDSWVERG